MSTEVNLDKLYENSINILSDLIEISLLITEKINKECNNIKYYLN